MECAQYLTSSQRRLRNTSIWRHPITEYCCIIPCTIDRLIFRQKIMQLLPNFTVWKPLSWAFILSNSYFDAIFIWRAVHARFKPFFDAPNLTSFCVKYHESNKYSHYPKDTTYESYFFVIASYFHDIYCQKISFENNENLTRYGSARWPNFRIYYNWR